jgi:hypothetical protein
MVEQITFQTIFQFLQTGGILVAVFYYITTLRNQNTARQAQLFMNMYNQLGTSDALGYDLDILSIEMNSVDDWDGLKDDRERYKAFNFYVTYYEGLGVLVRDGIVDVGLVAKMISGNINLNMERITRI